MGRRGRGALVLATAAGTILYGLLLKRIGGALPFVDALSTVASVAAMIISVGMFMEQWIIWIIVDVVTVVMWTTAFLRGSESVATLLMWVVYLGNAVIMYFKWRKEAGTNDV